MGLGNTETLLLQVDINANTARLAELQKQLNENKAAVQALTQAAKENRIGGDELAAGQVRLKAEAAALGQEMRVLTKANIDQVTVLKATPGSIEQLRAQLSLGTAEYNKLSQAERDNTEAGQKLQANNKALSDNLKVLEAAIGDTRRNVGNYSGAIDPLIQQLVKLQEQQKLTAPDSEAYTKAAVQIKGFQQAVNDAGIKAGLTYEQTQAKLENYGKAIQPATANLVKLEEEQKKVGAGSVEYNKIGFQIGKAKKAIEEIPPVAAKASDSIKEGFGTAVSKGLAPFQAQLDKGSGLLGKFKQGTELVRTGLSALKGGGETGALGFRALAAGIAATGIGLLLIAFTTLLTYFTQTNEGGKLLKVALAGVGQVVNTLANAVFEAGKYLTKLFTDPKQVAQDFIEFLKSQVVNRLNAFGVLIDGIRNRDFKKITDSVIQFNLGITDGTSKLAGFGQGLIDAGVSAAQLTQALQKLTKERKLLEVDEVLEKGRVEELIRLSKDRTQSAAERLNKLREAGRLENELSAKQLDITKRELDLLKQRNAARKLTISADEIQEVRDKQKEYNQVLVDRNNILATIKARQSRFILEEKAELDKATKERAAAAQKEKEDKIRAKITEQELLLLEVQKESAAEVAIKQRVVQLTADLEAAGATKTAKERELIQAKAQVAMQALADDFAEKMTEAERKRIEAQKKEVDREYAEAQKNLADYLDEKRAQLESDYANGLIGEGEYNRRLAAITKAGLDAELVNAQDYAKDTGAIHKKQADFEIAQAKRVRDEKKKIEATKQEIIQNTLQAGQVAADLAIQALGEETTAGRVALGIKKTLALAEIGINLEKQLAENALTGGKISESGAPLTVPLGIAYTISADALAVAAAAASGAKILGFNTGGRVPGVGNTDTVPALLTPGEVVMNQKASAAAAPLLSYLNASYGGTDFAPGYNPATPAVARSYDGGLLARQLGAGDPINYDKLAASMSNVQLDVGVRTIDRASQQYQRPRALTSLN